MKLLLDQNISYRVAKKLAGVYPVVQTVRDHGLYEKDDRTIWGYSRQHSFTIVTFDEDLYNLTTLYGPPPKIIWFKTGNLTNDEIVDLLTRYRNNISQFIQETSFQEDGCLAIYASGTTPL
ncbi:DUF5615 family PIN-like protein [Spirosoma montaniterrae]|uniref:DUF5615 domain-containing protein n=1 Tax=Spirosoma montaniterrae TaxID=1178516 RepID=A0A1P9X393_9BACT|nr:DUF5615 family PIN-like protein [Spirosoma montaniterrae]AQG82106.1 hypothetical protein AWR27_24095 [Spirosoma montaniterrae]